MTTPNPLERLVAWAKEGPEPDRVFEIRYSTATMYSWSVELSDDAENWSVESDCWLSLAEAVDHALRLAAEEGAK